VLTLSGFDGVGKSTLIEELKKYSNDIIYTESARYFIPLEDNLLKSSRDVISYKFLLSDLNVIRFLMENKINNVILDRNLIDSLVYLKMYHPLFKVDNSELKDHLIQLCEENNVKYLHQSSVLIKASKNKEQILKIISDPVRQYNSSVKEYLYSSSKWDDTYLEILENYEMISETFMVMNAYPEEKNGLKKIIQSHYEE
jgi:nicotinamide riboside kinase